MNAEIESGMSMGDSVSTGHGTEVIDNVRITGRITARVYTAPSLALINRPIELLAMQHQWDLTELLRGHHTIRPVDAPDAVRCADGTVFPASHYAWLRTLPPLPDHITGESIAAELESMLTEQYETSNLISQVGTQYLLERATGVGSPPAQSTGFKLGTGTTAPSQTGAGAALAAYLTGSNHLFTTGPTSSLSAGSRLINWTGSWGAGVINGSAIAECVIVNDAAVNATSTAANTYSRALIGPTTLGALDTFSLSWTWSGLSS